jgi:hypothetical protein
MPQFDAITFFNQVFWVIVVFFGFYFWFLKEILPSIVLGFKTRKKAFKSYLEVSAGGKSVLGSDIKLPLVSKHRYNSFDL